MYLKVLDAISDDKNKDIVRIGKEYMEKLDVEQGEVVEIMGKKKILAIVAQGYPGDLGMDVIRMDEKQRKEAKVNKWDLVGVRKAVAEEDKK